MGANILRFNSVVHSVVGDASTARHLWSVANPEILKGGADFFFPLFFLSFFLIFSSPKWRGAKGRLHGVFGSRGAGAPLDPLLPSPLAMSCQKIGGSSFSGAQNGRSFRSLVSTGLLPAHKLFLSVLRRLFLLITLVCSRLRPCLIAKFKIPNISHRTRI